MKSVADEIVGSGGRVEAAVVDAMNPDEVNDFVDAIVRKGGTLDLSIVRSIFRLCKMYRWFI